MKSIVTQVNYRNLYLRLRCKERYFITYTSPKTERLFFWIFTKVGKVKKVVKQRLVVLCDPEVEEGEDIVDSGDYAALYGWLVEVELEI